MFLNLFLVQFNSIYALKCKVGWGYNSKTSDTVSYNYADSTDCLGTTNTNAVDKPRGCYVSYNSLKKFKQLK